MRINLFRYRFSMFLFQYRIFWKLKALLQKWHFVILREYFVLRSGVCEEVGNTITFWNFVKLTLHELTLSLGAAVAILLLNPYFVRLPAVAQWTAIQAGDYNAFLAAIAGVGGVFIGLYYAGLTSVGSAIYSRVPNNIRDLLAREKVGNVYMRYLAFVTFLSLSLLGFHVFGLPRLQLAVFILILLSGVGIIAFVKLGQRAFYFFDPTKLAVAIFQDFHFWLQMACAGGYCWDNPSFQHHAHKQARAALSTFETLASISSREPHLNGEPFIGLSKSALCFLIFYQNSKKRIPSNSRWYAQRYTHKDWYRSEETAVSLANQIGTFLRPEVASDRNWLEEPFLKVVFRCVEINLQEKRFSMLMELLAYFDTYLKQLAKDHEIQQALNVVEQLSETVFACIESSRELVLENESLEDLALVEHLASLPVEILLSYSEDAGNLSLELLSRKLAGVKWESPVGLYEKGFKAYILPELEWLYPRLQFEQAVEKRVISPLWYQRELIIRVIAERFAENIEILINGIMSRYERWLNHLNEVRHPWLAGAVVSRGWEYLHKLDSHFDRLCNAWMI